jgi:hypothetical protein
MTEQTEKRKIAAPYIPFNTFISALDNVAQHSVPNVIDRSSFPSFSGASVAGTLSAFKYFGLIDGEGKPQTALHSLAMDKDKRKENVKTLLEQKFGSLIALDLSRSTPSEFEQAFSNDEFSVSGDTKVKAKTFFIKAAQYAGIPISKLLLNKSRSSSGTRKPRANKKSGSGTGGGQGQATDQTPAGGTGGSQGESLPVTLKSGGTLTLTLNVSILSLKGADRDFVFKLIDDIEAYESSKETQT